MHSIRPRIQVWSNDIYKAPLHQVKAQLDKERYSAPFFYNPTYGCDYAPVHTTVSEVATHRPTARLITSLNLKGQSSSVPHHQLGRIPPRPVPTPSLIRRLRILVES